MKYVGGKGILGEIISLNFTNTEGITDWILFIAGFWCLQLLQACLRFRYCFYELISGHSSSFWESGYLSLHYGFT